MNYTKTNSCAVILCSQVQTRFSGVISVAPRVCPTLPSETAPGLKSLAAHSVIEKKIVNFLHTKHVSHIVLYYNNIMKMPWCPYPMPPKKSTKKHKMGNMYSGTFSNKRTSKSLFKKSKVQLKKTVLSSHHSYYYYKFHSTYFSAMEPFFKKWNIFTHRHCHYYTIHNTHQCKWTTDWMIFSVGHPKNFEVTFWSLINVISKFLWWPNFQASPQNIFATSYDPRCRFLC